MYLLSEWVDEKHSTEPTNQICYACSLSILGDGYLLCGSSWVYGHRVSYTVGIIQPPEASLFLMTWLCQTKAERCDVDLPLESITLDWS